ncbi:AAA family ATPase [Psychrobacter sp. I-STPA6b]|uniref:AAA family ATPase n=1 Tax=Psychrobacter sp. I-STPA6b TaxID=2585718 RepID=UPI001D0CA446|nr:AAA family ATPase [Psychrobacter sp. I-STPA6b]
MSTGNVVTGDKYFPRVKDEKRIWRQIMQGSHILLLAPRRVGKTSLITHIKDNPKQGYAVIYVFVQTCDSEQSFYEKLLREIFRSDYISGLQQIKTTLFNKAKSMNFSLSLSPTNLELGVNEQEAKKPPITHEMIRDILYHSLKDSDDTVIIAIDEFPDVLEKIAHTHGKQGAEHFLSGIRALCQDPEFNKKVQFILTGSIGLDTLAEKLGVTDLINMLTIAGIRPLSHDEALAFIDFYSNRYLPEVSFDKDTKEAIIEAVGWNMPYYLRLVCEQLYDIADEEERNINSSDVAIAIHTLFQQASTTQFAHWRERLNRLDNTERKFAYQVLDLICDNQVVTKGDLFNLSQHPDFKDTVNSRYVINCLLNDGYLFQDETDIYQFTSPLFKRWWGRYGN